MNPRGGVNMGTERPAAWGPSAQGGRAGAAWSFAAPSQSFGPAKEESPLQPGELTGTMSRTAGNFGFIAGDDGEDMFVMPAACAAFGNRLPVFGTHLRFTVTIDSKSGRPRAENVQPTMLRGGGGPQQAPAFSFVAQPWANAGQDPGGGLAGRQTGTMVSEREGKFGFIQQDDGTEVFIIPGSSAAKVLPPVGARLAYDLATDPKTGRPRADRVDILDDGAGAGTAFASSFINRYVPSGAGGKGGAARSHPYAKPAGGAGGELAGLDGRRHTGSITRICGNFGFIGQDAGEEMFVLPGSCAAMGGAIPEIGTRVSYTIVMDERTGRPRAEAVDLEGMGGMHRDLR